MVTRIGINGFGRIGRCVAELLSPFKTNTIVVDPYIKNQNIDYPILSLEDAIVKAEVDNILRPHCVSDKKNN